ncbi:PREDICTED: 6-phosphogluconolactonase [Pseudopodoces humilis]|uniref:6-phosphogluconolactonase n=1 Tax=Pseudopodoces humilis TaxID=181119 RepID=UPI00039565A5|nr:PREDICTED: 6-phosphogluconolactonase [Pseudopodoces humilis]
MAAVEVFPSPGELGAALARAVTEAAAEAVASGGRFTLGLSGGSLVPLLARELPGALSAAPGADPSRWLVAFCDERLVPPEHPESTAGAYRCQVLAQFPPPGPRCLWVRPELGAAAASDYESQIRREFPGPGVPQFDLLLLGLGPDGHTCSLFPGHALLQEQEALVGFLEDSPKPPARRVTMTLPLLNAARSVLIVAAGAAKAPAIKRILEGREEFPLPAARIRPRSGRLRWLLDQGAAQELQIPAGKHPGNPGIPGKKNPGGDDPDGK